MKALLQGKPFSHPLHTALAHYPIGLFVLSLLLDAVALAADGGNALVLAAFYAMAAGVVLALIAAVAGWVDRADLRLDHPARSVATLHMRLNVAVIGVYVVSLALRYGTIDAATAGLPAIVLSCIGLSILAVSGYVGGTLVYRHGVGVGRHRRRVRTPRETITAEAPKGGSGFVLVARTRRMNEGEMLRVRIDGRAIVIVKVNGDFHAFQDFCTHRYGPLSEGCISEGQVQCPWHRSRFDVRTGKVTHGPAKVDLKTYAVDQRDGMLFVKID